MLNVKIVDRAFAHDNSTCYGRTPKFFQWEWLNDSANYSFPGEVIFFTDRMLPEAPFYHAGRKVALLLEPDGIDQGHYDYIREHIDQFDHILTFDSSLLALGDPKILHYNFGGCWISDNQIGLHEKTKFCSIIASGKNVTEGHRLRHEVIAALGGIEDVDVFGHGYSPVDDKFDALADYRYSIVIENCKQDDYFSEKLIDTFATGTIPIYWGTSQIKRHFNLDGVEKLHNVANLLDKLDDLRTRDFETTRKARKENLENCKNYLLVEDNLWRLYPHLFERVTSPPPPSKKSVFPALDRAYKEISALKQKLETAKCQRDKTKAERARLRFERNEARDERNEARAQRDELKRNPKFSYQPDKGSFFYDDLEEFQRQRRSSSHASNFGSAKNLPIVTDKDQEIGEAKGHYFYQDLHVARRVIENAPEKHVDVASRIDGFVAHVAAAMPITVLEIRDVPTRYDRIIYEKANVMDLDPKYVECCDSLSCLHVIEHFGLGRYGDAIDFEGHLKGIEGLTKMLRTGGRLYFSTPIGFPRINFNAHRVFGVQYLLDILKADFNLEHFSWVGDDGLLRVNAELTEEAINTNFGCHFGCGIFELVKKS